MVIIGNEMEYYIIMNILIPIIITSIAGLSTILGNVLLFIDSKYKDKLISFSLGLAFIVMFLISVIELIPVIESPGTAVNLKPSELLYALENPISKIGE